MDLGPTTAAGQGQVEPCSAVGDTAMFCGFGCFSSRCHLHGRFLVLAFWFWKGTVGVVSAKGFIF
jgi:hypothetical protein